MEDKLLDYQDMWTTEKHLYYLVVHLPEEYDQSAMIFLKENGALFMIDNEESIVEAVIARMKDAGVTQYAWPKGAVYGEPVPEDEEFE